MAKCCSPRTGRTSPSCWLSSHLTTPGGSGPLQGLEFLPTTPTPGREILVVEGTHQVIGMINELPEERRRDIAAAGRQRFLRSHMPQNRARQIEDYYMEATVERRTTRRLEVVA